MKLTSQIPLLGGFFQGLVILAVLLTFPASGGAAEPKRSRVPSPLEMAAILREGSDEQCHVAFHAILNGGPLAREMAEVLAQGMKLRSRRIQKSACLVLSDGKVDSQIVTSALLDAAASESLDLSRNATWSLKKIGISADTAAMIATRADELCRPEPTLYLLGNIRDHPDQVARMLTENDNVTRLLDDRKVCLHDFLPEMIASPEAKWEPVRKWAETTELLPANVAVMLRRKDHRAAIEARARLAEGIQKRYLQACAAALGSELTAFVEFIAPPRAELKWQDVSENKTLRTAARWPVEEGVFSTLIAFDLQSDGEPSRPNSADVFFVNPTGEVRASKQGYDSTSGRAFVIMPFRARYDRAALEVLDTLPLQVEQVRLRVKAPGHESSDLVVGYASLAICVKLKSTSK